MEQLKTEIKGDISEVKGDMKEMREQMDRIEALLAGNI